MVQVVVFTVPLADLLILFKTDPVVKLLEETKDPPKGIRRELKLTVSPNV